MEYLLIIKVADTTTTRVFFDKEIMDSFIATIEGAILGVEFEILQG